MSTPSSVSRKRDRLHRTGVNSSRASPRAAQARRNGGRNCFLKSITLVRDFVEPYTDHSKWSSDGWPLGAVWVVVAVGGWVSPYSNSTPGLETSPSRWLRATRRATTAPTTSSDAASPTHSSRRRPRRRGAMVRQASGRDFRPDEDRRRPRRAARRARKRVAARYARRPRRRVGRRRRGARRIARSDAEGRRPRGGWR